MKKLMAFFLFCTFVISVSAQMVMDEDDFSLRFKMLFESAAKRFTDEKAGEKRAVDEEGFKSAYGTVSTFKDAYSSRILVDTDDILSYEAVFKAGNNKEEAKAFLLRMVELIRKNLPENFILNTTYEMTWADPLIYAVEYDSDVFAEQAKKPSAKAGIIEKNGSFFIRLLVSEPVFKR